MRLISPGKQIFNSNVNITVFLQISDTGAILTESYVSPTISNQVHIAHIPNSYIFNSEHWAIKSPPQSREVSRDVKCSKVLAGNSLDVSIIKNCTNNFRVKPDVLKLWHQFTIKTAHGVASQKPERRQNHLPLHIQIYVVCTSPHHLTTPTQGSLFFVISVEPYL